MSSADRYLIWSNEHRAWWGPDHRGYTTVTLDAGVYPKEEADRICANANYAPGVCNEVAVLAPLNARKAEAKTARAGADIVRSFQELSDAVARFFDIPTPLITEHPPCKRLADAKDDGLPIKITPEFVDELRALLTKHCFVNMQWPARASIDGDNIPSFLQDLSALINRSLPRWLHMKRRRVYTEIARGPLQASTRSPVEGDIIVCYQSEGGDHYFREATEFEDGRFQPLSKVNPVAHEQSK